MEKLAEQVEPCATPAAGARHRVLPRNASKRLRGVGRHIVNLTVIALALCLLGVGIEVRMGNLHLQPVLSGSMRPGIQPGDLAVTWRVPTSSLRVGEVIVFYAPGATTPTMHRIVAISRATKASTNTTITTVTTMGDANHNKLDPWDPITITGSSSYRLAAAAPGLGWIPIWVGHLPGKTGRSILLILAGLLFGWVALRSSLSVKPGGQRLTRQVSR